MGKKQSSLLEIVFYPFVFSKRSFVGKDEVNPNRSYSTPWSHLKLKEGLPVAVRYKKHQVNLVFFYLQHSQSGALLRKAKSIP